MPENARIYTYTVIHVGAVEFSNKVPYVVAVVDDNESKFLTRIEGYREDLDIQIGMEVQFLKVDENGNCIYSFINE